MLKIFVIYDNGERREIDDLYWFEEQGVHSFEGSGFFGEKYIFEIYFNDNLVCEIHTKKFDG